MKCISLWQPWATLWISGSKEYETRSWPTNVRERIAVHAAKRKHSEDREYSLERPQGDFLDALGMDYDSLPRGCIVGTLDLIDCCPTGPILESWKAGPTGNMPAEYFMGDFSPGRYAWFGANRWMFSDPIPCKGQQGLWELDEDIVAEIRRMGGVA